MLHKAIQPEWSKTNKMDSAKFGLCLMPQIQSGCAIMIEHFEQIFVIDFQAAAAAAIAEEEASAKAVLASTVSPDSRCFMPSLLH